MHNPNRVFTVTEPSGNESVRCYHRGSLPDGWGQVFVPVEQTYNSETGEGHVTAPFCLDISDIRQGWSVSG